MTVSGRQVRPGGEPPSGAGLKACLDRFPELTLTVWGDLVADEFVDGEIARVSREAPVLILKRRGRTLSPGGGANAAANLAALGVRVRLVGTVGDDAAGAQMLELFRRLDVNCDGVRVQTGRLTPVKTRILAHHAHTAPQQVVRIDQEPAPLTAAQQAKMENQLARLAERALRASVGLLVSDYGYGAVSPQAVLAVRRRVRPARLISVDARFQIAAYEGVDAATPNEAELEAAMGLQIAGDTAALERGGRRLRKRLGCRHLLVTRGRDGLALFEPGQATWHRPVYGSQRAIDVTGAGDTVIAVFTAALAAGASGRDAAYLANCAGGVVVMKPGTATLSLAELQRAYDTALKRD